MKIIVSLGAVLALAGAAVAGPFSIGTVDASNATVAGGVLGTGLNFNGGALYDLSSAQGGSLDNTGEPSGFLFNNVAAVQFDSYITVDSGPTVPAGYDGTGVASAGEAPGSLGFSATGYSGAWFVTGPFIDAFSNADPNKPWELFVARITLTGGFLSGNLAVAFAEPTDATFTTIQGNLINEADLAGNADIMTTDINGNPFDKTLQGRGYAWVVKQTASGGTLGGFGAVPDVPAGAITYDIYLQNVEVPTPGALGLLGVAGLAAIRRRR